MLQLEVFDKDIVGVEKDHFDRRHEYNDGGQSNVKYTSNKVTESFCVIMNAGGAHATPAHSPFSN